jgi:hypothetical protein
VRTCTLCKDKLFHRDYAKKYATKPKATVEPDDKPSDHYCDLCRNRKPTSKNRATVRLPRTRHGRWEREFSAKRGLPWCNHDDDFCQCDVPPTMAGPTVEMPKLHKATHKLPDNRWVCDECCDGHCKRCTTDLPQGKRGARMGLHLDGSRRDPAGSARLLSASDLFG